MLVLGDVLASLVHLGILLGHLVIFLSGIHRGSPRRLLLALLGSLEDLIGGVVPQIEDIGELYPVVVLHCPHHLKVEGDSLQVDYERVWAPLNRALFLQVRLLVAGIAVPVADDLRLDHFPESVEDAGLILDLEAEEKVVFQIGSRVSAVLAPQDLASLDPKDILEEVFLTGVLQQVLELIEGRNQELLGVLLLSDIRARAIEGFEGEAERGGVVVLAVGEDQEAEHLHRLVQKVVIDLGSLVP